MATNDNRISAAISPTDAATIHTGISDIRALMPFLINLMADERMKKRKTGTKREGYVLSVYNAGTNHPDAIPSSFKMTEWDKDEALNTVLKAVYSDLISLAESINDTLLQISFERIKQADEVYGYLKNAAKGNAALTEIVDAISEAFAGQGGRRTTATLITIEPNGTRNITNATLDSYLVNEGDTLLKVTMENGSRVLNLRPADAVKVSSTKFDVVNLSTAAAGSFSVKLK